MYTLWLCHIEKVRGSEAMRLDLGSLRDVKSVWSLDKVWGSVCSVTCINLEGGLWKPWNLEKLRSGDSIG